MGTSLLSELVSNIGAGKLEIWMTIIVDIENEVKLMQFGEVDSETSFVSRLGRANSWDGEGGAGWPGRG